MNPLELLQLNQSNFTRTEQKAMKYILKNPHEVIRHSIIELANDSHASKSAIIRLCQKIGYVGFSEFKFDLSRYIIANNQTSNQQPTDNANIIIQQYMDYISKISHTVNPLDTQQLAQKLKKARHIKFFGCNRTGLSAWQIRYRLSKIGIDAEAVTDVVLMRDTAALMHDSDLVVIFSITCSSANYADCVKILQENKCPVVLITMNQQPPLAKNCTQVITLPCISVASTSSFLDDQIIFFTYIEILLSVIASL